MKTLQQRKDEDFRFFVLAHAVGDPAMYELLRDRDLDEVDTRSEQRLWEGA